MVVLVKYNPHLSYFNAMTHPVSMGILFCKIIKILQNFFSSKGKPETFRRTDRDRIGFGIVLFFGDNFHEIGGSLRTVKVLSSDI